MSSARLASLGILAALVSACARAAAPPAPVPAAELTIEPPAPVPRAPPDPAVRRAADQAVERWAQFLDGVEDTCRTTWADDTIACASGRRPDLVDAYAAFYGAQPDPRAEAGRADTLPRLAANQAAPEAVLARMNMACEDRCGSARRLAIADALPSAIASCAGRAGKRACARLREGRAASPMLDEAVDHCEDGCESERAQALIEKNRPKTKAQELACLRACVARHGGARLVVHSSTDFHVEATDWCGTPAFTCAVTCAPASGVARYAW